MSDEVRPRQIIDTMAGDDLSRERMARLLTIAPEIMEHARAAVWHRSLLASEIYRQLDGALSDTIGPMIAGLLSAQATPEKLAREIRGIVEVAVPPLCDLAMSIAQRQMMAESIAADGGPVMRFGDALEAAKKGGKIARQGWNGKGMWVTYMPETTIPADKVNERTRAHVPDGDLHVGAYFVMMTATGVWQPGWLASQADMDADDWLVVT